MLVCVFGSVNIDYRVKVPRPPKVGETMQSTGIEIGYGGKVSLEKTELIYRGRIKL
jgi:hypothetical protein